MQHEQRPPASPQRRSAFAGLLLTLVAATTQAALPEPVRRGAYELELVGAGQLEWLGFDIYAASLWSRDGRFQPALDNGPYALSLWYERRFSTEELLQITAREWTRLGHGSAEQREAWARQRARVWPDVDKGDNMTAVVVPGSETRFYNGQRLLGRVTDPAFGPAYLAIWLDPRSAVRDLRNELLGSRGTAARLLPAAR